MRVIGESGRSLWVAESRDGARCMPWWWLRLPLLKEIHEVESDIIAKKRKYDFFIKDNNLIFMTQ